MAKTKFRPLHDRVVVKRIDAEEKSKGGIIIPDTVQEKPSQGEVIAVWGPVVATRPARSSSPTSRPATGCCSANGPALKSSSTVRTS
jgi:hypothetical protein